MATEPSSHSTAVAWSWAIESLASLEHIDVSILIDLVKKTPGGTDNLGRSAREMFSFKALKSLFFPESGITKGISSSPDSSMGFDSSKSCADVLENIMLERPGSNKKDELEKSKCDVQPFIMHKGSCLPKCALEQLKDAILEGSHPRLVSLKEKSGLVLANRSERGLDSVDGDCNGFAHEIEGNGIDAQICATKENASSVHAENRDDLFGEKVPNRNLVPSKRVWSSSAAITIGKTASEDQVILESSSDTHSHLAKKLKQDHACTGQTLDQNSFFLHESNQLEDTLGKIIQHMETRGCEFSKERQAVEGSGCIDDDNEEYTAAKTLEQSSDVGNAIVNNRQAPCNEDKVAGDIRTEGQSQIVYGDEGNEESEGSDVVRTVNNEAKYHKEPESSGYSAGYLKEITDIATKKHALLSQKFANREEIFVETHWKDLNICVKCNKGGHLLVCSSDACPLVFHETCLNSGATFDTRGNFYCYFCTYSQLLSKFKDVKKRYSWFRNNIAAFISLVMNDEPKNFFQKSCVSEQMAQKLDRKYEAKDKRKRNVLNQVGGTLFEANTKEVGKSQTSVLHAPDHDPCEDDVEAVTNGKGSVLPDDKQEEERSGCSGQSPRGLEEQPIATQAVHRSQKHAGLRIQQGIASSPVSDVPRESGSPESISSKRSSVPAHEKPISSNYSLRFKKEKLQNRCSESHRTRRMKAPWTKLEEETLKEGVQKFSNFQERGIPWSRILEFGRDVFHKGRTTIDLKDKWRNMCKKAKT